MHGGHIGSIGPEPEVAETLPVDGVWEEENCTIGAPEKPKLWVFVI